MAAAPSRLDPATYAALTLDTLPGGLHPEEWKAICRVNPRLLADIRRAGDVELADALAEGAPPQACALLMQRRALQRALPALEHTAKAREMEGRLRADPNDLEAQQFIEESIQRENVDRNYELAHDTMPEAFARHVMLYVKLLVNGVPQIAMVDTGAQMTCVWYQMRESRAFFQTSRTQFSRDDPSPPPHTHIFYFAALFRSARRKSVR